MDEYSALLNGNMGKVVGYTAQPLDGKFKTVRNAESNLGNFVCDLWREACGADCVLLNSGSLRRSVAKCCK